MYEELNRFYTTMKVSHLGELKQQPELQKVSPTHGSASEQVSPLPPSDLQVAEEVWQAPPSPEHEPLQHSPLQLTCPWLQQIPFASIWLPKQHKFFCLFAQKTPNKPGPLLQQVVPQTSDGAQQVLPFRQTSESPGQHLFAQIALSGQHVPFSVPCVIHDWSCAQQAIPRQVC